MPRCPHCGESHGPETHFCSRTGQPLDLGPRLIGQTFLEGYEIVGFLGEGPVGAVLEVERKEKGKRVRYAAKMLHPRFARDEVGVERFLREAELAGSTGNDHIAQVFATGRDSGGAPLVVREFMVGQSLDVLIESNAPLPISRAIRIARQILEGLEAAHEVGVGNFDLSPGDVFLVDTGDEHLQAKLVDFGEAHLKHSLSDAALQRSSPYLAPEMGSDEADERVDLWSVACVLYEMLTGHIPFDERPDLTSIKKQPAKPVRQLRKDIDRLLEAVLQKSLSPNLSRRYQNAGAFEAALARAMGDRPSLTSMVHSSGASARPSIPAPGTTLAEEQAARDSSVVELGAEHEIHDDKEPAAETEEVAQGQRKASEETEAPEEQKPTEEAEAGEEAKPSVPAKDGHEKEAGEEKKGDEDKEAGEEKKGDKDQGAGRSKKKETKKDKKKERAAAAPAASKPVGEDKPRPDEKKSEPRPSAPQKSQKKKKPAGAAARSGKKPGDRSKGATPSAEEVELRPPKKPIWPYIAGVAVVIAIGLAIMLSRDGDGSSTSHAQEPVAEARLTSSDNTDRGNTPAEPEERGSTEGEERDDGGSPGALASDGAAPEGEAQEAGAETEPEETEPEEPEPEEPEPEEPEPEETEPEEAPPAEPTMVMLSIRTTPPNATITVDGEDVGRSPYRGEVERSGRVHMLRATAEGYRPAVERVRFDQDREVVMRLAKRPPRRPPRDSARPPRQPTKRPASPPSGGFRRDNPFD